MADDRQITAAADWALAADGVQWILQHRHRRGGLCDSWDPVAFVHSTKTILARCMREKGVPPATAGLLLAGLPATFDAWKNPHHSPAEDGTARKTGTGEGQDPPATPSPQTNPVPAGSPQEVTNLQTGDLQTVAAQPHFYKQKV